MRTGLGDWRSVAALSLCVVFSYPGSAVAEDPPFDPAIDVQLFDLVPGPRSFMSVADGSLTASEQFSVDFLMTYLTDPFVIFNVDESEDDIINTRTDVVSSMVAGQLVGAYGLTNDLQLGVSLPLVFSMTGDGLDPATGNMSTDGLQASGIGDLRLEAKGRIMRTDNLSAAWHGGVTVPTSFGAGGNDYLGDDLPAVRGGASAHWQDSTGRLRAGGSVGVLLRKARKIYASEVGQQLSYGVGVSYKATDDFSVVAESFGRSGLTSIDLEASPLEVGAGIRVKASQSIHVLAGGGAGVVSGIGSPGLRFVVSVGYAPDLGDTDNDGLSNMNDQCPLLAEDMDQFEDSDGCPEDDNDGDRREDSVDKCPNEKEDIDGFEDEDGCPEPDNDNDGILDGEDRCPVDAEDGKAPYDKDGCPADKRDSDDDGVSDLYDQCPDDYEDADGFEDWDGCPEADNDRDGIADDDDECPLCPEDADGFEDSNGCPDLDNDGDGISDRVDQCPDQAEVLNGVNDEDGCPDTGGKQAATLDGNRLVLNVKLRFSSSNELRGRGLKDAASVAAVMRQNSDVTKWRIVVAARTQANDDKTRAASQAQADALRNAIIAAGVSSDAIEALGAVSDKPIVAIAVVNRAAPEEQDFSCPADMIIKQREKPAAPATTAPAVAPAEPSSNSPVPAAEPTSSSAAE